MELSPLQKAALLITKILQREDLGLNINKAKYISDITLKEIGPDEVAAIDEMIHSMLFGEAEQRAKQQGGESYQGDAAKDYADLGFVDINEEIHPNDSPSSQIRPNLQENGGGSYAINNRNKTKVYSEANKVPYLIKKAQANQLGEVMNFFDSLKDVVPSLEKFIGIAQRGDLAENIEIDKLEEIAPTIQGLFGRMDEIKHVIDDLSGLGELFAQNKNEDGEVMVKRAQFAQIVGVLRAVAIVAPLLKKIMPLIDKIYDMDIKNIDLSEIPEYISLIKEFVNDIPKIIDAFSDIQSLTRTANKKYLGGERMSQDKFMKIQNSLLREAMKAELSGDSRVLAQINKAIEVNEKVAYKTQVYGLMKDLIKEAAKYEIRGDLEKLAQVEEDIRYLQRDYEAFKDVNVFSEQEEGVVTMGYAKPEYNMGAEHTVNPMNVMDPKGKIRDMKQFPSGDDKRTEGLNKAKPRIPMAEDGKGNSSISKVVKDLETVKILDEKDMEGTPQKEQPAVPDSLPKLSSKKIYLVKIAGKYEDIPKSKIVFPPTKDDENGHFPIDTENRARAALSYVNKYKKLPSWAKKRGIKSLQALVTKVTNAVEKKYPGIEVSEEAKSIKKKVASNKKTAQKIIVRPGDEVAYSIADKCPVGKCECGHAAFKYHPGNTYLNEGYECADCGEFYSVDSWERGQEPIANKGVKDINQKIANAVNKNIAKKAQMNDAFINEEVPIEDYIDGPNNLNNSQPNSEIDLHQGNPDIFGRNPIGQEIVNKLLSERGESINILSRAIEKYSEDIDNEPVVIGMDNIATVNRDYTKNAIDAVIDQMGVEETIVLRYIKTLL